MLIKNENKYKFVIPPDDGSPIKFVWYFPRGLLQARMSAFELCEFVLKHMNSIISTGLLSSHQRIKTEFETMFIMLATNPRHVIDRLLPWIRVEYRKQDDDIIHLNLFETTPHAEGVRYYHS